MNGERHNKFLEEKVELSDGPDRIVGILHKPNLQSRSVIILVHGFTGSKDGPGNKIFQLTVKKLLENEFSVFRFDFRGSGESSGNFKDMTVDGEVRDLVRMIAYMKHLGFDRIGVVGESLGGTISIKSYSRDVNCIVLWYPAIILRETGLGERFVAMAKLEEARKNGFVNYIDGEGRRWEVGNNFIEEIKTLKLERDIAHIRSPTLLIHAEDDTTVDIKQSKYAFNILHCEKELEKIKTGGHNFIGTEKEALDLTVK